jgi:hypothetical protein
VSLELARLGHGSVATCESPVCILVPLGSGDKSSQAEQWDFVEHIAGISGHRGKPLNRRSGAWQIVLPLSAQQRFNQHAGRRTPPQHHPLIEQLLNDGARQRDGAVVISEPALLSS